MIYLKTIINVKPELKICIFFINFDPTSNIGKI